MKRMLLLFSAFFCSFSLSEYALNATDEPKTFFEEVQALCTLENGKKVGLGALALGIVTTIPLYIGAKNKIDTYQKMLNIHHRFVEVFPYFESWKKHKSKVDLIKLINEADREALVHEHQQARYLYNALKIAVKNYNNYMLIFQYVIKKKVSLEKLTDLDAALDFLRIFIKKSELIVTAKLVEKIEQDPYFSLETKSVPIKAVVLFPHHLNENYAIDELKQKLQQIAFVLTPYKEFLLSKKVSPTRDLLLQTINDLLHTIKKDLDYYHMPIAQTSTNFAAIHTSINPSDAPQLTPLISPLNPVNQVPANNQPGQTWNLVIPMTPMSLFQKIKSLFIRQPAAPVAPVIPVADVTQPVAPIELSQVIAPAPAPKPLQYPTIQAEVPVEKIEPQATPVAPQITPEPIIISMPEIPTTFTEQPTAEQIILSEEEAKKAQIKKYAILGGLLAGTGLLASIVALGIISE